MHAINTSVPKFTTVFRGICIIVTSMIMFLGLIILITLVTIVLVLSLEMRWSHSSMKRPWCGGETLNFSTTEFAKGLRILKMVMTIGLTPRSHYNTITKPRACFLLTLMEDLFIDFPSHMIESMIDIYRDTATCDKLIFPSTITRILSHVHVTTPLYSPFYAMGAISKESI